MQASKPVAEAEAPVKAAPVCSVTSEDVAKINTVIEKINALKDRAMSVEDMEAVMLSKTDPDNNAIDLMLEAKTLIQGCLARSIEDSAVTACLERLSNSMDEMARGLKDGLATMANAKEAQTASQSEIDKLKKRLSQIETDLEEKDKTLLDQETQMLALTDQVEDYQKIEEGLN